MKLKIWLLAALALFLLASLPAQSVAFKVQPQSLTVGQSGKIIATLSIPEDRQQIFDPEDQDFFFLSATHPSLEFGKTIYPKTYKETDAGEKKYFKSVSLELPFVVKKTADYGKSSLKVTMGFNLCYPSGACDPPDEVDKTLVIEIAPAMSNGGEGLEGPISETMLAEDREDVVPVTNEVVEMEEPGEETASPWQEVLKFIIFAFLGGIILNITPCVLPILPIRIMSIINHAQKDRSKVLAHTLIYTLGVLISFAAMGAIFVGLQAAGQSAGWGTQNQNPYFVITLMAIVFVFALSLLGVFEITAPGMNTATKATSKGGYSGSFFGGIFAFLMAISCTGPFLGAALPFAMKLSPSLIMVFFMMIGLGFAFPFILIGLFPKALKIIPKPGDWMVLFKELMGFVLLYLVFTMLRTTLQLTGGGYFLNVIYFMLILGFSVWLYGKFVRMEKSRITQWIFTLIPLILIVWSAYTYLPIDESHTEIEYRQPVGDEMVPAPHAPEGWYVFTPELYARLATEGKSVFLDIGAAWCKNCHTNEKTVLFTPDIMADFAAKGVVLLRGDFTRQDDVLFKWMQAHDRMGVPFNALYIPNEEPILFPELITKGMVREALAKVPAPKETK